MVVYMRGCDFVFDYVIRLLYWSHKITLKRGGLYIHSPQSQPAVTCSKLTTETLEQGVKYIQSYQCSSVSIVNFE